MTLKTLVMATDLSERADRALDRALKLTKQHGCRLTLIHVVDDSLPDDIVAQQVARAKELLGDDIATRRGADRFDISIEVLVGDPFREIVDAAGRQGADLLIAGMHRKDSLRDLVSGTTIGRVIRSAGCPVLLARNQATRNYGKVMVATDFSPASRFALAAAVSVAPTATFQLVHTYHVPYGGFIDSPATREALEEQSTARLNAFAKEEMAAIAERFALGPKFAKPRVIRGSVFEALPNQAVGMKADMLAIGTHGRTGIGRILLGSVAESLIADPPTDLLVARAW